MIARTVVLLALALAGCGVPSSFELCEKACDVARRCGPYTEAAVDNCKIGCLSMKAIADEMDAKTSAKCKNYADVQIALATCYDRPCDQLNACFKEISTSCVPK